MGGSSSLRAREKSPVFLLAENRLLRETLSRLLQKKSGICVVGECQFSDSAIERITDSGCDISLLDDPVKTASNPDLIEEIRKPLRGEPGLLHGIEYGE